MQYAYDVFISYKRDPVRDEWLDDHFIPLFSSAVRESITAACRRRPQKIFFDRTEISKQSRAFDQSGIEPGDEWRAALKQAILTSRCMVAIWSPLYFYSDWCLVEWNSFRRRPRSVVVPISVHDGESFPDEAQALQARDFSEFVIIGAGFKETKVYPEFQVKIRSFADAVAARVRDAPDFQAWAIDATDAAPAEPEIPQRRL